MILPVDDNGVRPAGSPNHCFYCASPKGEHKQDCVCRERTVVVEMAIAYVRPVPAAWDKDEIEFLLNDSSSCADNEVRLVAAQAEAAPENHCNTCERTTFRYLREAGSFEMEAYGFNAHRLKQSADRLADKSPAVVIIFKEDFAYALKCVYCDEEFAFGSGGGNFSILREMSDIHAKTCKGRSL